MGEQSFNATVDADYVKQVSQAKEKRRPTHAQLEELEGEITAIDLIRHKLSINTNADVRVDGEFMAISLPILKEYLGRRVKIRGNVTRKGSLIELISIIGVTPTEE